MCKKILVKLKKKEDFEVISIHFNEINTSVPLLYVLDYFDQLIHRCIHDSINFLIRITRRNDHIGSPIKDTSNEINSITSPGSNDEQIDFVPGELYIA